MIALSAQREMGQGKCLPGANHTDVQTGWSSVCELSAEGQSLKEESVLSAILARVSVSRGGLSWAGKIILRAQARANNATCIVPALTFCSSKWECPCLVVTSLFQLTEVEKREQAKAGTPLKPTFN